MSWKVKEEYKNYKAINMNLAFGDLLQHQIENLSEEVKKKYFTNTTKPKKKRNKTRSPCPTRICLFG